MLAHSASTVHDSPAALSLLALVVLADVATPTLDAPGTLPPRGLIGLLDDATIDALDEIAGAAGGDTHALGIGATFDETTGVSTLGSGSGATGLSRACVS